MSRGATWPVIKTQGVRYRPADRRHGRLALTPTSRRVAAAGFLSLAALVCSSCTTAQTAITAGTTLNDQVASLNEPLECVSTYPLYDDVYHESSMRGLICVDSDGVITQVRAYASTLAATVALQDWALDPSDQWLCMMPTGSQSALVSRSTPSSSASRPERCQHKTFPPSPRTTSRTLSTSASSSSQHSQHISHRPFPIQRRQILFGPGGLRRNQRNRVAHAATNSG